ncbi:MAG: helix-turn-helix transcriptional regulator [Pikeienuella sp.]
MGNKKLIELAEQAEEAPSSEALWNLCHRALGDLGVAGIGYGIIPYSIDARINGVSKAGFFRYTYPKEWKSAAEHLAQEDNDLTIEWILDGCLEVIWEDIDQYEAPTEEQILQNQLEYDIGMKFGASLALDVNTLGQPISGIGLWINGVKSEGEFAQYWQQYREQLVQVCYILDEGIRNKHTGFIVSLSPRERDCLTYLAIGLRPAEICWRLGISEKTFEKHIKGAKEKLRARTRDHAVAKALVLNLIQS